jgi:hypothetical protein
LHKTRKQNSHENYSKTYQHNKPNDKNDGKKRKKHVGKRNPQPLVAIHSKTMPPLVRIDPYRPSAPAAIFPRISLSPPAIGFRAPQPLSLSPPSPDGIRAHTGLSVSPDGHHTADKEFEWNPSLDNCKPVHLYPENFTQIRNNDSKSTNWT